MRKESKKYFNSTSSKNVLLTISLLLLLFNIDKAYATTYTFNGTVTQTTFTQPSGSNITTPVSTGDNFTGYFSYDFQQTPIPDHTWANSTLSTSVYGRSSNLTISYALYFKNLTVFGGPASMIYITNGSTDVFRLNDGVPSTTPNYNFVNGVGFSSVDEANLVFTDSTGTIFNDTSLPETLNFDLFDTCKLILDGVGGGPVVSLSLDGNLNNFTDPPDPPQPVPEPATILLVGVGLGGIVFRRKRGLSGK